MLQLIIFYPLKSALSRDSWLNAMTRCIALSRKDARLISYSLGCCIACRRYSIAVAPLAIARLSKRTKASVTEQPVIDIAHFAPPPNSASLLCERLRQRDAVRVRYVRLIPAMATLALRFQPSPNKERSLNMLNSALLLKE